MAFIFKFSTNTFIFFLLTQIKNTQFTIDLNLKKTIGGSFILKCYNKKIYHYNFHSVFSHIQEKD